MCSSRDLARVELVCLVSLLVWPSLEYKDFQGDSRRTSEDACRESISLEAHGVSQETVRDVF